MVRIKLIVKNFEIVRDAVLVIQGITSIVGETDSGKTAVYNAVKAVVYNLAGKGYIRREGGKMVQDGSAVAMMFEEDKAIVQFFKRESPRYVLQVDGEKKKFEKVGRGTPPDEIVQILNMGDLEIEDSKFSLNFIGQLEAPLLKQLSMFQLYKVVVKSFDGERIQEAITVCKDDQDVQQKDITKKEIEIEVQKRQRLLFIEQLKKFIPLDDLKPLWSKYDVAVSSLPQLEEWRDELSVFKVSQRIYDVQLEELQKIKQVEIWMKEYDVKIAVVGDLRELSINKELYEGQYKVYSQQLKNVDKVCTQIFRKEFIAYISARDLSVKLQEWNNEVLNIGVELEFYDIILKVFSKKLFSEYPEYKKYRQHLNVLKQYSELLGNIAEMSTEWDEQIEDLQKQIDEQQYVYDNNLCPTCGSKMKIENKEAMEELRQRIEELQNKKVGIEAKKTAKKEQVDAVYGKISKAGYDPKKLPEEIKKLEKDVDTFEKKALPIVEEVEKAVADAENTEHLSNPEAEIDTTPVTSDFE